MPDPYRATPVEDGGERPAQSDRPALLCAINFALALNCFVFGIVAFVNTNPPIPPFFSFRGGGGSILLFVIGTLSTIACMQAYSGKREPARLMTVLALAGCLLTFIASVVFA